MNQPGSNDLTIPTDAIPTLRAIADALTKRLGAPLNYAQTYVALTSAQASGDLDAIGCRDFMQHAHDPRMIETVAALLEQNPKLLDELRSKKKLQGFD